jgi:hypothetical protein
MMTGIMRTPMAKLAPHPAIDDREPGVVPSGNRGDADADEKHRADERDNPDTP